MRLRAAAPLWGERCCALCPGVVDWHNCGIVLGVLESGLGIGWNKYLTCVTLYVGMGPLCRLRPATTFPYRICYAHAERCGVAQYMGREGRSSPK